MTFDFSKILVHLLAALVLIFNIGTNVTAPVYSDMDNWLHFGGSGDKEVDIFIVYPTLAESYDPADLPFVQLDNEIMRDLAYRWVNKIYGIVSPHANVYVPLYRQINAAILTQVDAEGFGALAVTTPRDYIFEAFAYYLEFVNKGERPFILLGFSQGAWMVAEIATEFLGSEQYIGYNDNHIITYAIGIWVTQEQIDVNPLLSFSQSPYDTGVIVSWNSTAPCEVESGEYRDYLTWREGALVTNPLSWLTDGLPVPAPADGYADAAADNERGLLIVSSVDAADFPAHPNGILSRYHSFDILFFADSISQNIEDRITIFLE